MLYLYIGIAWYIFGVFGFLIHWERSDINIESILLCLFLSLLGPFTWLLVNIIWDKSKYMIP
jgi:multisubunit Na+/H+ antiporter MnhG subunit